MLEQPLADLRNMNFLTRQDIEKASSAAAKNIYLGSDISIAKVLSKYKIYVDGKDAAVVPHLLMDGFWESWITKFIAQTVEPGSYCIDAGANFGYYSLLLAELSGKEGKTIAIEPNAHLCKLLALTANLNEYGFMVSRKAISNYVGETVLSVPAQFWGGASIVSKAQPANGEYIKENVPTDTLDNIVKDAGFPRVDFIKMDCEGAEPLIFEGMSNVLGQNPQLKLVMEYSPFSYMDAPAFTELIFNRFEVGEIGGDCQAQKLSDDDKSRLLNLSDHIDLYLSPKNS